MCKADENHSPEKSDDTISEPPTKILREEKETKVDKEKRKDRREDDVMVRKLVMENHISLVAYGHCRVDILVERFMVQQTCSQAKKVPYKRYKHIRESNKIIIKITLLNSDSTRVSIGISTLIFSGKEILANVFSWWHALCL